MTVTWESEEYIVCTVEVKTRVSENSVSDVIGKRSGEVILGKWKMILPRSCCDRVQGRHLSDSAPIFGVED